MSGVSTEEFGKERSLFLSVNSKRIRIKRETKEEQQTSEAEDSRAISRRRVSGQSTRDHTIVDSSNASLIETSSSDVRLSEPGSDTQMEALRSTVVEQLVHNAVTGKSRQEQSRQDSIGDEQGNPMMGEPEIGGLPTTNVMTGSSDASLLENSASNLQLSEPECEAQNKSLPSTTGKRPTTEVVINRSPQEQSPQDSMRNLQDVTMLNVPQIERLDTTISIPSSSEALLVETSASDGQLREVGNETLPSIVEKQMITVIDKSPQEQSPLPFEKHSFVWNSFESMDLKVVFWRVDDEILSAQNEFETILSAV